MQQTKTDDLVRVATSTATLEDSNSKRIDVHLERLDPDLDTLAQNQLRRHVAGQRQRQKTNE